MGNSQFPDEAVEFLEQYCKEATKMITKKCSNNVFDLFTLNGSDMTSLSTKLTNLSAQKETPNTRVFYSDIPKWEMTPGQAATFLCINIEDNYITFIPHNDVNNDFIELNEIITKYTDTNTEPYSPILDELCLAKYEDEWYRAKIKSVNTALEEYDVYYIDYGNTATVPSMEIREMPKDFASKVPALAVLGYLTKQVKDEVAVGECYKVKIIRKMEEDNSYEIDIPELSKKLRNGLDY
ncbi:Tudor domain [Popillia japonica]|uniref:Tudor domain n=1 Tax=Popillia japonica TaxID=7064 RepID=A0AAW1IUW2_POPJA